MRPTQITRVFIAIAIMGLAINSSCAPDKKKTPVNRGGGGGGAGGANILTNRAQVQKQNGSCPTNPETRDASKLQPLVDKLSQPGTPITFDQLPQGQYRLTKTYANLQVTGAPVGGGSGDGGFDVYRASTVSVSDGQAVDTCADFAMSGEVQQGSQDVGRNFPIDSYFDVQANKTIGHVDASAFRFILSAGQVSLSDIGVNTISDQDLSQLKVNNQQQINANQAVARRQNRPANQDATKPHIPTPIKKFFHKQPADKIIDAVQSNPSATSNAQLYRISDTEYALGVTFNEAPNVTRKVLLVYGMVSTAKTTQAGANGMTANSIPNKDAAPSAAPKDNSGSTTPPADTNQQPPGNQQSIDAQAKAAVDAAAAAADAGSTPAAPTAAPPANPARPLTPQDEE